MAIITEESDSPRPPLRRTASTPPPKPSSSSTPPPTSTSKNDSNPFTFWFYFTLTVSLITFLIVSLSTFSPQDPKSWFLSLPTTLRHHYSTGRTIKVQTSTNSPPIEVFTIQNGPPKSENILFVHGLGCSSYSFRNLVKSLGQKGFHTIAIDLPGSGFSDKSVVVLEEGSGGVLGPVWEFYSEIKEKGLFWGFDQLVEKGYVDYEQNTGKGFKRESVKPIELGPEEMGRVLGQIIDAMGLAPVDLVLHDSALGLSSNWVFENSRLLRSLTLIDTTSSATAFPLWVLDVPLIRELVLGFSFVFKRVVEFCCSKSIGGLDVEAHRILLKGRDGRRAAVGMGKKMNHSFDLMEWGSSEEVKSLPMQVIWSKGWSQEWSEEGNKVANALPKASFVTHSGGRWPQDDVVDELAESIFQFLSTLPKPVRRSEDELIPEHIQKMFVEAKESDHHHHDSHGHGGHDHDHGAGYMDAYGLGHGWAS